MKKFLLFSVVLSCVILSSVEGGFFKQLAGKENYLLPKEERNVTSNPYIAQNAAIAFTLPKQETNWQEEVSAIKENGSNIRTFISKNSNKDKKELNLMFLIKNEERKLNFSEFLTWDQKKNPTSKYNILTQTDNDITYEYTTMKGEYSLNRLIKTNMGTHLIFLNSTKTLDSKERKCWLDSFKNAKLIDLPKKTRI